MLEIVPDTHILYFAYQIIETLYPNKLEYLMGSPTGRRESLKSGATRSGHFSQKEICKFLDPLAGGQNGNSDGSVVDRILPSLETA